MSMYSDDDLEAHVEDELRSETPYNTGDRVRVTFPGDEFEGAIVWCDRSGAYVKAPDGETLFFQWVYIVQPAGGRQA